MLHLSKSLCLYDKPHNPAKFLPFAALLIGTIYVIFVSCYRDKYQLNSRLTHGLLYSALRKECTAAFWHHLRRLATPIDAFYIKTAGIFLLSLIVVAESC